MQPGHTNSQQNAVGDQDTIATEATATYHEAKSYHASWGSNMTIPFSAQRSIVAELNIFRAQKHEHKKGDQPGNTYAAWELKQWSARAQGQQGSTRTQTRGIAVIYKLHGAQPSAAETIC